MTVHLWGVVNRAIGGAMLRMATTRRVLRRTHGLRFAKLVGTGSGRTFSIRDADPNHWGLVAAWDNISEARAFERSEFVTGWDRHSFEKARFILDPIHSRGRWSGQEPFSSSSSRVQRRPQPVGGQVAAITRARIPIRHWRRFAAAVPPVAQATALTPGLIIKTGIGEVPVGLQGTFSVWETAHDLRAFAQGPEHQQVIDETARVGWYKEELFARFNVVGASGSFCGVRVDVTRPGDEGV